MTDKRKLNLARKMISGSRALNELMEYARETPEPVTTENAQEIIGKYDLTGRQIEKFMNISRRVGNARGIVKHLEDRFGIKDGKFQDPQDKAKKSYEKTLKHEIRHLISFIRSRGFKSYLETSADLVIGEGLFGLRRDFEEYAKNLVELKNQTPGRLKRQEDLLKSLLEYGDCPDELIENARGFIKRLKVRQEQIPQWESNLLRNYKDSMDFIINSKESLNVLSYIFSSMPNDPYKGDLSERLNLLKEAYGDNLK